MTCTQYIRTHDHSGTRNFLQLLTPYLVKTIYEKLSLPSDPISMFIPVQRCHRESNKLSSQTVKKTNRLEKKNLSTFRFRLHNPKYSSSNYVSPNIAENLLQAQLFSTNTFSPNKFCHSVLSTFTAIYFQSIENRDKSFINFYQEVQTSR